MAGTMNDEAPKEVSGAGCAGGEKLLAPSAGEEFEG